MNIVFVHFRTKPPKHLILNIKRTIKLFPQHKVYLVTDFDSPKFKIKGLLRYDYKKNKDWDLLERQLVHDKDFRNNFWFLSLVRFLALSDFMLTVNEEILHIESDVIIAPDFPFKKLSELNASFLFPIINYEQAIASCLYLKDSNAARFLSDITMSEVEKNPKTTDMLILRMITRIKVDSFKVLSSSPLKLSDLPNIDLAFYKDNLGSISYFDGVFDGVDIGMYLFGQDPRNGRGFSTIRKPTPGHYLNVSDHRISIIGKREFPYIFDFNSSQMIPIYSLHIHCKNWKLFDLNRSRDVIRRSVKKSQEESRTVFYFFVFITSLKIATIRRLKSKLTL
jgi:hypothetical protein